MSDNDPENKIRQLMRESVPKPSNVTDFAAAARKLGRPAPRAKPAPVQSMKITGNNNAGVIGNNNHIQMNVRGAPRPKIQITPSDVEVTNEQAAEIRRLILKVAEISGKTHQHVYGVIYRRFEATSYLLIKRHKYDEVVRYLSKWIASESPPTAIADAETDRKQLLKRIHAQARKTAGGLDQIHAFISGRFGTSSLADLMPGQLREVIKQFRL